MKNMTIKQLENFLTKNKNISITATNSGFAIYRTDDEGNDITDGDWTYGIVIDTVIRNYESLDRCPHCGEVL